MRLWQSTIAAKAVFLEPHVRKEEFMRKLVGVLIGIVVIIVILVFALPSLVNVNQYHDKIQAELQDKLHRDVKLEIGRAHV